jgi:hypothetical protein
MVRLAVLSVISLAVVSAYGAPIPHRRQDDDTAPPTADDPQAPIGKPNNPPANATTPDAGGSSWKQTHKYAGQDFLDPKMWDYFSSKDPTNGMVNYQPLEEATKQGLATVGDDGIAVLAVDDKTKLNPGDFRNSVRISSVDKFNGGLFIADFAAMPHGCSVWPAWWSVGPGWPAGGEIDVLEGVHDQTTNQYTLHTSEGCSLAEGASATAKVLGTTCASGAKDNTGCAYRDSDDRTYGKGFNAADGGVYAHIWNDDGIKIWHFARADIPADITSGSPNPSSWPKPAADFKSTTCDMKSHFYDHVLTIDTTLCGDWAGATYSSSGCPGTCAEAVADPNNFKDAKWKINSITVYSEK